MQANLYQILQLSKLLPPGFKIETEETVQRNMAKNREQPRNNKPKIPAKSNIKSRPLIGGTRKQNSMNGGNSAADSEIGDDDELHNTNKAGGTRTSGRDKKVLDYNSLAGGTNEIN